MECERCSGHPNEKGKKAILSSKKLFSQPNQEFVIWFKVEHLRKTHRDGSPREWQTNSKDYLLMLLRMLFNSSIPTLSRVECHTLPVLLDKMWFFTSRECPGSNPWLQLRKPTSDPLSNKPR